jgi:GNAT superfamily N-acetyltransferase
MPAPIEPTLIERDGASLECFVVPWDTAIAGFGVAQIDRLELRPDGGAAEALEAFGAWCAEHDVRLVSCRLDHLQLRESMALEAVGFRFVEMVLGPRLDPLGRIAAARHPIEVSEALQGDLDAIEAIAYSAFDTGRFLLDHRLPPELSRRRYAAWVRNAFAGEEQTVLKAEAGGDLIGFFIVEERPAGGVYWHLTAIAPKWQGKGLGLSLWQTMLQRHRASGAPSVETTISGHNLPAINLYARLGFTFGSAQMTFHWLGERPEARP